MLLCAYNAIAVGYSVRVESIYIIILCVRLHVIHTRNIDWWRGREAERERESPMHGDEGERRDKTNEYVGVLASILVHID